MCAAKPNQGHYILTNYQQRNNAKIITQNVDNLHQLSGSEVLDLHGNLRDVYCLQCHDRVSRGDFQKMLGVLNPDVAEWSKLNPNRIDADVASSSNPDGDVDITWDYNNFKYPACISCKTGLLKPDVVFFGENIQVAVKEEAFRLTDEASCLVVIGSSLTTYSALRLVKRAHSRKIPIVVVNMGTTRGDSMATFKINEDIIQSFS
jgi:NAD-dependent deacetylase sirtuin 4